MSDLDRLRLPAHLQPVTPSLKSGSGDGTYDDMNRRITALEDGQKAILAALDKLREGQHAAALAASDQKGGLNTSIAEINGKLLNIGTMGDGLRRDVDKLPTKFDIAGIITAILGIVLTATLIIKNYFPHIFGS